MALVLSFNVYWPAYRFVVENQYRLGDFFQEWASAKNHFEGLPVYTPQSITAWRYLRQVPDTTKQVFVQMNGHPPTCVLLSLPFAKLDYAAALWLWNVLSIAAFVAAAALALRLETGSVRSWYWMPILAVALGNPMKEHVILGQLTTFVLLLIVGAVVAEKHSRPALAGVLLGTAAAIKLYPALLFLYFVMNKQWRSVAFGAISFALWHLSSACVLGLQTYADYVQYAMPEVLRYRDWVMNFSVTGLWYKLFDGSSGQTIPLWQSPLTAKTGALACNAVVVATAAWITIRSRKEPAARQSSLALLIVAMILVSPIAWDHYFLLLLWPLLRLARDLPWRAVPAFVASLGWIWINPLVLLHQTAGPNAATPSQVLGLISAPFYALVVFYVFAALRAQRDAVPLVAAATQSHAERTAVSPAESMPSAVAHGT